MVDVNQAFAAGQASSVLPPLRFGSVNISSKYHYYTPRGKNIDAQRNQAMCPVT